MNRMYEGHWCPHHSLPTRLVGQDGHDSCDPCTSEWQRAVINLLRDDKGPRMNWWIRLRRRLSRHPDMYDRLLFQRAMRR